MKVYRVERKPALGHHIAGDRAVDTARQHEQPLARTAGRHTAGTGGFIGIYIGMSVLPEIDVDGKIGVMQIDFQPVERVQQHPAELAREFHGRHGKALVRPIDVDAEGTVRSADAFGGLRDPAEIVPP